MYLEYYGLTEQPFNNTPDPRFLYYSKQHEEAMMRLMYVVEQGKGAGMVTGIFGSGKTLLAQALQYRLEAKRYKIVYINNPAGTNVDLLRLILNGFGHDSLPSAKSELLILIERLLIDNLRDGMNNVVVIDEAHSIEDRATFDEIRLLLNFQVEDAFLLSLLLFGQPELKNKVENYKPLLQRISMRYHLEALSFEDTAKYILFRLKVANAEKSLFTKEAIVAIYKYTGGIPRRINQVCDLALYVGSNKRESVVKQTLVEEAAAMLES